MIDARELRIGNLISYRGEVDVNVYSLGSSFETVRSWQPDKLYGSSDIKEYEPIELTEEWHNKFGVKIDGFKSFVYKLPRNRNIDIEVIFTGDYVMLRQKEDNNPYNDSIVSIWNKDLTRRDMNVHEWQNLYFALTGEELKMEDKI